MIRVLLAIAVLALALGVSACGRNAAPPFVVVRTAPGTFDMCIAANQHDDFEAIAAAEEVFRSTERDPMLRDALQQRAARGEPPPPPIAPEGLTFFVNGQDCTYRWAPLADSFAKTLGLGPPAYADETARGLNEALALGRASGTIVPFRESIYWSRERPRDEWGSTGLDYFMLIREEPKDQAILGEEAVFTWDRADRTKDGRFELYGKLEGQGPEKLLGLTTRNRPEEKISRSLAILVRGNVITVANINGPLGDGRFAYTTERADQVEQLLAELRGP